MAADGCVLPFPDSAFDVVFSNSVIEHLTTRERQQQFANEVMRIGKRCYVQTPNRWFPVETHLLAPFVHYLPKRWQSPLVYIEHDLSDVRLLDRREMQTLFPKATIVPERFLGFTKSLIARVQ